MDNTVYIFKNMRTGEVFTGNQTEFRHLTKISSAMVSATVHSDKHYTNGWCLCDVNGIPLTSTIDKRKSIVGNNHHLSDKLVYTIQNVNTGVTFVGTRADIKEELTLNKDACNAVVRGHRQCQGWTLVSVLNKDMS